MTEKIDPNTIDWHKFEVIFPYLKQAGDSLAKNTSEMDNVICPVCGVEVQKIASLFHITAHGTDPTYGIEYNKALEILAYLQLTISQQ